VGKLASTLIATALLALATAGSASARSQNTWAAVGHKPLSDRAAAAQVTHRPEGRPANVAANNYRVTNADLRYFRSVKNPAGQTSVAFNHWNAYVDGRSTLRHPSTDDLIQWAAHKWGIPENWIRAQAALESNWQMNLNGDLAPLPVKWVSAYPRSAYSIQNMGQACPSGAVACTRLVYMSVGITQIKWTPDNLFNQGTRYLRYRSTAFDLDYMAAEIRYYYDGDATWLGRSYHAGNKWLSMAAWNAPAPWNNAKQQWYVSVVQQQLRAHPWTSPNYVNSVYQRN
jgi:hypothetical protein